MQQLGEPAVTAVALIRTERRRLGAAGRRHLRRSRDVGTRRHRRRRTSLRLARRRTAGARVGSLRLPAHRLRCIHAAAVAGDDAVELGQGFDLVDNDAAHLRGAVGRLLRQFENALAEFPTGRFELALHFGRHLPHALKRLGEPLRRLQEQLVRFARVLIVDVAEQVAGALTFLFERAGAFGARVRDHTGDLAGLARGAVERLVEQRREALQPLFDIVGTGVERADQRFDRRLPVAESDLGVPVGLVDQRDRVGQRAALRVELRGELAEVQQRLAGDRMERLDVLVHLGACDAALLG